MSAPVPDRLDFGNLFTAVRAVRNFEDIALQIQLAIENGHLNHGDRLPSERELRTMFGVSRATVREALRVLEGAGLLEARRGGNGGIFVREPHADQVARPLEALIRFSNASARDLLEFRGSFEGETAYWAAKRAEPSEAERLMAIARQYGELAKTPGTRWAALVDLDIAFHEQIAQASHNEVRAAIMLAIHRALRTVALQLEERAEDVDYRQTAANELLAIAQAISRGHQAQARRLLRSHVMRNAVEEVAVEEPATV